MIRPVIAEGWLKVPYSGPELVNIFLAQSQSEPATDAEIWKPAFLDWHDGTRVAQIRPDSPSNRHQAVWLMVDGQVTKIAPSV